MKAHFAIELENILQRTRVQGTRIAEAIERALSSFREGDTTRAEEVIQADKFIDQEEIRIEEECLKLLALYQPVASDLRALISVLKINTTLERMADFGCHMAERTINTARLPQPANDAVFDFVPMQKTVLSMIHDTLTVITRSDVDLAYSVIERDNTVDSMRREHRTRVQTTLHQYPNHAEYCLECHGLARDLERTADLCTDICEHIIYMRTARIIRHQEPH